MAGVKRGRPAWEDIEDVDQLHELLSKMDAQHTKLKKEVKELKAVIKAQVADRWSSRHRESVKSSSQS